MLSPNSPSYTMPSKYVLFLWRTLYFRVCSRLEAQVGTPSRHFLSCVLSRAKSSRFASSAWSLRVFFSLEPLTPRDFKRRSSKAVHPTSTRMLVPSTQLTDLHTFPFYARRQPPFLLPMTRSSLPGWPAEMDQSTMSGRSEVVVMILWGNFNWRSRSTLLFSSTSDERRDLDHDLVLLLCSLPPCLTNWISCCGAARPTLFASSFGTFYFVIIASLMAGSIVTHSYVHPVTV